MTLWIGVVVATSIFFGFIYIFLICCWFGKGTKLLRGYVETCTNLTDDNKKEQKFVSRIYVIKSFILSMFAHSGILCLGFKQFIVGGVLIGLIFPVWGLIELILQNNKKYFTAKQ